MHPNDPDWIAPRSGQDWRDDDVQRAVDWLKRFVPSADMDARLDTACATLLAAQLRWRDGEVADPFDPNDIAAWFILQGETFATDRRLWVPGEAARIIPFLTRLGKELDTLKTVPGVEARAARMMTTERRQPEGAIFELLVALAYKRRGWTTVEFVPEEPGGRRTPDIHVAQTRRRWAVECKRMMPSQYARRERELGRALANPVHALSLELGRSLVVEVVYKQELSAVPPSYLSDVVRDAANGRAVGTWDDSISAGQVRDVEWALARRILSHDDVYFGSSRMIEIIVGRYRHDADHSFAAKWRPAAKRPFYAEAVYQASAVSWWSISQASHRQKARHFRSVLANAEGQLPADRPGVIHVGVESQGDDHVDALRHIRNFVQAHTFSPTNSRLRWVYGNYFVPEVTTRKDECWAITETMAPYRIGNHRTRWPLPGHMLISPEDEGREGMHWDGLA